jgi:hypothetical protein
MSDYIKSIFDVLDGKVSYDKVGKKKRGRKAGYKHSTETKQKIAEKMKNRVKTPEVRNKISKSLLGRAKPDEVKEKISRSKTKHTVAEDILNHYSGHIKEKDVPTPTAEYLEKHGYKKSEVCSWIRDNYEALNSGTESVCTESHLKALSIKEEALLDQDFNYIKDDWRH